jgi:hypothetical protein
MIRALFCSPISPEPNVGIEAQAASRRADQPHEMEHGMQAVDLRGGALATLEGYAFGCEE